MIGRLLEWAMSSRAVVLLLTLSLAYFGGYAFLHVNVEAYPDPAPAIIEVVAQFPGGSTEEVERLVTIPLEVALSGMSGLKEVRSKSIFALSYLACQFEYGVDYYKARQEVINRMQMAQLPARPGGSSVTPQISGRTPTGEIYRYLLTSPRDAAGQSLYTLNDLKALQDYPLQREFRRLSRLADITAFGGS